MGHFVRWFTPNKMEIFHRINHLRKLISWHLLNEQQDDSAVGFIGFPSVWWLKSKQTILYHIVGTHDILIICRYLMVNIPLFFHAFATGGHDISVVAFAVGPWEAGAHHHHSARSSGEAEARHGHHFGLIMDYEHISLVHLVYKYICIMERGLLCAYYVYIMCIYIYIHTHFLIMCI